MKFEGHNTAYICQQGSDDENIAQSELTNFQILQILHMIKAITN